MALVPQIVDAVQVPVVAAGELRMGEVSSRPLRWGPSGILLSTRFVATQESEAPDFHRRAILERGSDATMVTDACTGLYARWFRNRFTEDYAASGAPVFPALVQARAARDIFAKAAAQRDPEYFPMPTGQSAGLIHDLPGAADVVQAIVREARSVLPALSQRVRLG
jgi:nitronate monooxygenase